MTEIVPEVKKKAAGGLAIVYGLGTRGLAMTLAKRLLLFVLVGAIVGEIVATLIAPGMIAWWNTPGTATQMICDLPVVVRRTIADLVRAQLIGAGSGAALFLILGIIMIRAMARRARKKAATLTTR